MLRALETALSKAGRRDGPGFEHRAVHEGRRPAAPDRRSVFCKPAGDDHRTGGLPRSSYRFFLQLLASMDGIYCALYASLRSKSSATRLTGRLWLSCSLLREIEAECTCAFPYETGGILLGYRGGVDELVVTAVIGPGTGARHSRYAFSPDQDFQEREVARIYRESGRNWNYLVYCVSRMRPYDH
jgi:hypothetical protein